jgi:hypothetical protein
MSNWFSREELIWDARDRNEHLKGWLSRIEERGNGDTDQSKLIRKAILMNEEMIRNWERELT